MKSLLTALALTFFLVTPTLAGDDDEPKWHRPLHVAAGGFVTWGCDKYTDLPTWACVLAAPAVALCKEFCIDDNPSARDVLEWTAGGVIVGVVITFGPGENTARFGPVVAHPRNELWQDLR